MARRIPEEVRQLGRQLRAEGCSIKQIAEATGMAKSSVSLLVRDVPLTPAQEAAPPGGAIQEIGGFERPEWLDLQGAKAAPTAVS